MITAENIARTVADWIRKCENATAEWRDNAILWYNMVSGEQWSVEEKAEMRELLRPTMTFNRVGTFVDAAQGLEISNRQEVTFLPREQGDVQVNQLLTNAAKWVREQCDAEDEESDAFFDLLVAGMGWTETRMDYEADVEGMAIIERIDPLEMRWDMTAKKRNLSDANYVMHMRRYKRDEALEKWPELADSMSDPDMSGRPHDAENAWRYEHHNDGDDWSDEKKVIVAHVQWKERTDYFRVGTPQGVRDVPKAEWEQLQPQFPELQAVPYKKTVYRRAFVAGNQLLGEIEDAPSQEGFTFKCMTGKRDRNTNTWYGLVKPQVDPQKWSNKFYSSMLQDIATNGKGIMAEQDAFVNWQETEENWTNPAKIVKARVGALSNGKIMPKPSGNYPAGTETLLNHSVTAFRDVTGINLELMGLAESQQAGVLEAHRKQAGMTILSWCFDSLRRYRKEQGRILADFIQKYLSDGRLVRIGQKGQEQYVPLLKQHDTMVFDAIVDDAPNSVNQKEKTWAIIQSLLPVMAPMGMTPPPDFVDYLPIPDALAMSWKQSLSNQSPKDMQIQQLTQQVQMLTAQLQNPMTQLQIQELSEKNRETRTKADLNIAKIQDMGSPVTHLERVANINKLAVDTGNALGGKQNG